MHRTLPLLLVLAGCGASALSSSDTFGPDVPIIADTGSFGDDDDSELPEEYLALPPSQTDIFVFVANPTRDTVTRINVLTGRVDTVNVGVEPRLVVTDPNFGFAVVLNRGDDTITRLDADSLDQVRIEVREGMNRMTLSPDGRWLMLWHDPLAVEPEDPDDEGL